jgi:hypothetical protein
MSLAQPATKPHPISSSSGAFPARVAGISLGARRRLAGAVRFGKTK